ncbi:MAG: hypothetical protein KAJ01_09345, partial [Candidatus Hydrogenedentes bacterium]|nr:hypothetical protein [Candidatus Hydrogenedentota bacterium]
MKLLLSGRDNRYVRRAMRMAAKDRDPTVRAAVAPLAARLGNDDILRGLLEDTDLRVVSAAALDAGIAARTDLVSPISRLLDRYVPLHQRSRSAPTTSEAQNATSEKLLEVVSCSAYALAKLSPKHYSPMLCDLARRSTDPELRDRLLVVLAVLNDTGARQAVMDIIHSARWARPFAPAMALEAAARMKLTDADMMGMEVLTAGGKRDKNLLESQVIAALDLAAALKRPCRREVYEICRNLWYPNRPAFLVRAARLLGIQVSSDEHQPPGTPDRETCIRTLREAVQYSFATTTIDDGEQTTTTPLGSAAAAVAM